MSNTTQIIFIIFMIIFCVCVLVQAAAMIGVLFAARKTKKKVEALTEDFRIHLLPVIGTSRGLLEDLSPKIKTIASNLVESTDRVRTMAEDVNDLVKAVVTRTHTQTARVDGMVSAALDQINDASQTIHRGISTPLRQVNGIVNGVRAGIQALCDRKTPSEFYGERDEDAPV